MDNDKQKMRYFKIKCFYRLRACLKKGKNS